MELNLRRDGIKAIFMSSWEVLACFLQGFRTSEAGSGRVSGLVHGAAVGVVCLEVERSLPPPKA